jgi:hypothetical protein
MLAAYPRRAPRKARMRDPAPLLSLPRRYTVLSPVRLLIKPHGDMTFEICIAAWRNKRRTAVKLAPAYLVASHQRTAS